MVTILIRRAVAADLPRLVESLQQEHFFVERMRWQDDGQGTLFVALADGVPVGDVYLRTASAEEPEVRQLLPGVPLLQHLEVHACWRNQGIGQRLIAKVEDFLIAREHQRVALGVSPDNENAIRLYGRLGFRDWGHGVVETRKEIILPGGGRHFESDKCYIFVKSLPAVDGGDSTAADNLSSARGGGKRMDTHAG